MYYVGRGRRTLGLEKGLWFSRKYGAWLGGQITGHQENMWLGSLKSAWVPDRWTFRKFSRKLGWWDRRLKPYPGVVCNGLFGFPVCGGGQVKCAQLHCSDINICRPLHNDDIVH